MCDNANPADQNAEECDDERVVLANLIANLKLDTNENKKIQKQLKKANTSFSHELQKCKSALEECKSSLENSNRTRDTCIIALPNKEIELEKYKTYHDRTTEHDILERKLKETLELLAQKEHDIKEGLKNKAYKLSIVKEKNDELVKHSLLTKSSYEGLAKEKNKAIKDLKLKEENDLDKLIAMEKQLNFLNEIVYKRNQSFKPFIYLAWERHTHDTFRAPTTEDMTSLLKTCLMPLALKTQNYSFIFVNELKQDMLADLEYVHSLEKEIDELESDKADFSNIYDLLLQECVSKDVTCSYLHSLSDLDAYNELQCVYVHKVKECECLAEKLSKQTGNVCKEVYNGLLRSFAKLEKHSISLELALQQCQEQMKNDIVCKENESTVFLKEREQYFKIQYLKAQLQNKNIVISELKKLIDKCKGKSVDTKFDKPSVVRQPNAQKIPKPSVLGKSNRFSDSLRGKVLQRQSRLSKLMCQRVYQNQSLHRFYLQQQGKLSKKPQAVPIRPRKSKRRANQSVATPPKKTIVQLILFIVDSGCIKHMMGNLKLLCNFVEKYLGTVHFGNVQFAPILGYEDLVQGNITIKRVYYVEGLNHNLFSVGQFCDADLEVAFKKSSCFVRDLQGNDLLTDNHGSDLYIIYLQETMSPSPIYFLANSSPTQAWLWHRRLSYLNFDTINLLSKKDIEISLPKVIYVKDQLCSSCELEEGIEHQTSTPRTPEQNGVVERRNRTLVEAARTMLSASKLPLFFWAKAIAIAGHRDHLPACLAHMLYCVVAEEQYNLAYFLVKRIQCARYTPTANLSYGMFLTRLYRYVMEIYPHLDNGIYDIVDQVMRPLALKQTRRPRSDRGKAHHSVSSSSSHHQGTSSHQHVGDDDDDDDNV
ncbi:retrovirus-related pol polyprotein from transposon TNT 1-94 [Tanacetum coccineum]|uniref:Retrovirus-related pol polyprotein from transposon TNT 1-94 n=1 Tax=Tanacetum coccineum TaxID=301880 RepID=A0ABQ5FMY2_9ASTR